MIPNGQPCPVTSTNRRDDPSRAGESHMLGYDGWDAIYRVVARKIGCQAPIEGTEKDAGDVNMENAVLYALFERMLSAFHE
jgi:hypothetical protein